MDAEQLIRALQECIDATARHDKAREGRYDWGYFGQDEIRAMEAARERFGEALNQFIDDRVAKAVAKTISGIRKVDI